MAQLDEVLVSELFGSLPVFVLEKLRCEKDSQVIAL
jgi:hypothetical protein